MSPQEDDLLAEFALSFGDLSQAISPKSRGPRSQIVREVADGLYHLNSEIIAIMVAFLMQEYLRDHPKELADDGGFAGFIYWLVASTAKLPESISEKIPPDNPLARLNEQQLRLFSQWTDHAMQWECCADFWYDLRLIQQKLRTFLDDSQSDSGSTGNLPC